MSAIHLLLFGGILILALVRFSSKRKNKELPLPPGPKPLPLIGNLHQAPALYPWRVFQQWGKQYGPIIKLQFGPTTIILLNNHETAHDLLNKRSGIYSSRPRVVMAAECLGHGMLTLLMPYAAQWKAHQRLQMSVLNARVSQTYCALQELESTQLVFDMLSTNNFTDGFRRYSAGLIFALAYGKRIDNFASQDLKDLDQVIDNTLSTLQPGWIVDLFPILNHLPRWLAPWKRLGDKLYKIESEIWNKNYNSATSAPSWNWSKQIKSLVEKDVNNHMSPMELAYDVGIIWEVSTDTTTIALEVFILAAVLHPHAVKKAREELIRVVGNDRLPSFTDKENLPYIHAFLQEVLRWRPVAAGGVPHALLEDDVYKGYRIPKGATIIANQWAICHDEGTFPYPENFDPERWLKNPDLPVAAFGHGRRTCFGQHIARNSLFIIISRFLWAFDIECASEQRYGHKIWMLPDPLAMTQGFNSKPEPFQAVFKPRSPHVEEVVRREWKNEGKDINDIMENIQRAQTAQTSKA
ncbi:Cytochrome P450 [Glarea lozoyensis ATCC 20868]|uniref:Cytochrome P450 n=1 Tax=Glarea lozoyensis (strain ATCC 20868 / MF5171) TaxID=1116229 RepID=S3D5W1_GLAL2|nr:Cytochrome P450 [Glarea lozoyensis ATCC 20868]EPE33145.1 Cytochrome P450 [Glarea lozoyensis ATCC 20868]